VQTAVEGEYLEVSPPRLLVHTWLPSWTHPLKTVVRWELEPHEVPSLEARVVRIRHEGFAGKAKIALDHESGWKRVLGWMQGFVEAGKTIDTPDAS